jgi:hypothetical protein
MFRSTTVPTSWPTTAMPEQSVTKAIISSAEREEALLIKSD